MADWSEAGPTFRPVFESFEFPSGPTSFILCPSSMKAIPHSARDGMGRWSRRRILSRNALGLGSVALAWLLREEQLLATPPSMPRQPRSFDLKPKVPPQRPQARAMISLPHGEASGFALIFTHICGRWTLSLRA